MDPPRQVHSDLFRSLDQKMAQFLEIDLAIGLTFAAIALESQNLERRQRNKAHARKAFEVITAFLPRTKLNADTARRLIAGLDRLRTALQNLEPKQVSGSSSLQKRMQSKANLRRQRQHT